VCNTRLEISTHGEFLPHPTQMYTLSGLRLINSTFTTLSVSKFDFQSEIVLSILLFKPSNFCSESSSSFLKVAYLNNMISISLLSDFSVFLYPPSEDSVLQVTEKAYNNCAVSDPILRIDDGNSVFNLTSPGQFYYISGIAAHCLKNQKLMIDVLTANGTFFPPAEGPAGAAMGPTANSPSYPVAFGPSAAQSSDAVSTRVSGAVGFSLAVTMMFLRVLF
jgi:Plastocyanin-like domain